MIDVALEDEALVQRAHDLRVDLDLNQEAPDLNPVAPRELVPRELVLRALQVLEANHLDVENPEVLALRTPDVVHVADLQDLRNVLEAKPEDVLALPEDDPLDPKDVHLDDKHSI